MGILLNFEKKYLSFIITSSENVNNNLSYWFCGINIMPVNLDDTSLKWIKFLDIDI